MTIDTISGIKDSKTEPSYVRWVEKLEFKIQMDMTKRGSIFRAYIIIEYKEKNVETISRGTTYPVSFTYEYYCDYNGQSSTLVACLAIFISLAFIWSGIKVCYFKKRNPAFDEE